jgi:Protein kinase domain/AAA ATPase domain
MQPGDVIAGRYRVLGQLGGGGMAVVYEVVDSVSGRRVALKRPHASSRVEHQKHGAELFAREFHTLIQLAHPRIVEAYDYGIDEHGAYYTMELLDGGDLQSLMPVGYHRACVIASDVCSALSLLHSRQIVHRDISPRNIRCTSDGLAKLIDFGAMTHMGPSKELVGTPVYCAPEVLEMRALDARTDLFALGASLYYALTGHHPYPARDFAHLPNAWRFGVARPSELAPDIPDALDVLVLDLLQLRPEARPSNAAEVMDRLSSITGIAPDEQLLVAQAYLATPAFVGREAALSRAKARSMRALAKRGSALLIEGPSGSGRSRFLDACLLNSKLLGMTVVRADAGDGESEYGVVRRWLSLLLQMAPDATREAAEPVLPVIAQLVPSIVTGLEVLSVSAPDLASSRPQLQAAVRQTLLTIAQRTPLLLAVDDLKRADEPSLAAISLVAQNLRDTPLLIVATAASDISVSATAAYKLFDEVASTLELQSFSQEESRKLLASVFGDSHALDEVSQRLHALSGGSPRDLMRLAQHLVDSGSARYHAGSWSLVAGLGASGLPANLLQLLSQRLKRLPPEALELARTFALCPQKSFGFDELRQLSSRQQPAAALDDIEQLTRADIVRATGARTALADQAWVPLLLEGLSAEDERALHQRLANVFEARPDEAFRHARHLLRAGQVERALDAFVAHAIASRTLTDKNPEAFHQLLLSLPDDWLATYEQVLQQLRESRRPLRDEYAILLRLAGMAALTAMGLPLVNELTARLKLASGLGDWEQLGPALDPPARLKLALERAGARYAASAEAERFADPGAAIRELAGACRMELAVAVLSLDLRAAQSVPSLEPLVALSPALGVAEQLAHGIRARLSGRFDLAREIYRALLERFADPARSGLEATHLEYARLMILNGVAMLEAAAGLANCLETADRIEKNPVLQSNAWLIRMVYQLWQGNSHEAERSRRRSDLARLQNSAAQSYETVQLTWQLAAYVAMEDLTRVKRSLDELVPVAARFPAFRTVLRYGELEHQRIRGDSRGAASGLAELLRDCEPGSHQIWAQIAAAHVRALDAAGTGQSAEAAERGRAYLAAAERAELGPSACDWISLALCVPAARCGEETAARSADALIESCRSAGVTGLRLGLAYEARARIAILQGDADNCDRYRSLCEKAFANAANSALSAKLLKLKRDAQTRNLASLAPLPGLAGRGIAAHTIKSRLSACTGASERATVMLTLLAQQSGAQEGYLYCVQQTGLSCVASLGSRAPDLVLENMVREYIAAETQGTAIETGDADLSQHADWTTFGQSAYRPVLLSHYLESGCTITGMAVFAVEDDRPFSYPGELASSVSRMLQASGDVTGVMVAEED